MFGIPSLYAWLLGGVAALALLGSSYGLGYVRGSGGCLKAQVAHAEAQTQAVITRVQTVTVDNLTGENQLQATITNLVSSNKSLREQLNERPDPQPDVHLTLGDVRLLNLSRLPSGVSASGGQQPSGEDASPSTLTLRAFEGQSLDDAAQYYREGARCDALRDEVIRNMKQ